MNKSVINSWQDDLFWVKEPCREGCLPKIKGAQQCASLVRSSDVSDRQKSGSGRVRVLKFFSGSGRVLKYFFGFGSGSGLTWRVRDGFRVFSNHYFSKNWPSLPFLLNFYALFFSKFKNWKNFLKIILLKKIPFFKNFGLTYIKTKHKKLPVFISKLDWKRSEL